MSMDANNMQNNTRSNHRLIAILALIHTLNLTRSAAILSFSWAALHSSVDVLPLAVMLLIGESLSLLLSPGVGKKIVLYGAKTIFLFGEACCFAALCYFILASIDGSNPSLVHLVAAFALMTLGSVVSYPAVQTLLRDVPSNGKSTRNASLSNFCSTSAYVIGPLVAGWVLQGWGTSISFVICLLGVLTSIMIARFFVPKTTSATKAAIASPVIHNNSVDSPVSLVLMIALVYSAFTFLSTYLAPLALFELKTDATGLGALRSGWSVGAIVGTITIALVTHRREPSTAFMALGAMAWATGLAAIAFADSQLSALVSLLVTGVLFAIARSSFDGMLLRTANPSDYPMLKSKAQAGASAFSIAWILLAFVLPPNYIAYSFLIFAGLVVAGALFFLIHHQRQPIKVVSLPE